MSQMLRTSVPFVTTRAALNGVFGPPPEPRDFSQLAFGSAAVVASPEPYYLGTLTPGQTLYNAASVDPGTAPVGEEPDPYLVAFLSQWIRAAQSQRAMPLLYFHGFEYTFEEAVTGTGDLATCFANDPPATQLAPLVFSFATQDDPFGYVRDRKIAEMSGPAAARMLVALRRAWEGSGRPRVMLLAHSMGNYVLECACAALPEHALAAPTFAQAALMAADVQRDVIGDPGRLGRVARLARWVTVGINLDDPITGFVALLAADFPRLACCGPQPGCSLPANVRVVDYTHAISAGPVPPRTIRWDYIGHSYYHTVPAVRADVAHLFADVPPDAVPGRVRQRGGDQDGWLRVVPPVAAPSAAELYGGR